MEFINNRSVLVCVTEQITCERLIYAGSLIAKEEGLQLNILSVLNSHTACSVFGEELEYLYEVSKEVNANMSVYISDNILSPVLKHIRKNSVGHIIVGRPESIENSSFVKGLLRAIKGLKIHVVDHAGNSHIIDNNIFNTQQKLAYFDKFNRLIELAGN